MSAQPTDTPDVLFRLPETKIDVHKLFGARLKAGAPSRCADVLSILEDEFLTVSQKLTEMSQRLHKLAVWIEERCARSDEYGTLNSLGEIQGYGQEIDRLIARREWLRLAHVHVVEITKAVM